MVKRVTVVIWEPRVFPELLEQEVTVVREVKRVMKVSED